MSKNIIRDGQTKAGYLELSEGRYEPMEFTYRPMLPETVETVEAFVAVNSQKDPVKTTHCVAAMVAKHIETWGEVEADGKPSPIIFENVRRLPFPVLNRLYRILAGLQASDPRPAATAPDPDYVQNLIAEVSGAAPIQNDEAQVKN